MIEEKLKVADFFCGAGGFSEGFRQMSYDIVFGLDNWGPAIDTIKLNHPGINAVKMNILDLETPSKIDEIVPDTEIIIGSPPCVAFSGSNNAGKADKGPGIILIEQFLKIIAWKMNKPNSILKYWILENVPNSGKYIKNKYTFNELGLPGGKKIAIKIIQKNILNADDYGTPQGRKRFFCGNYPKPKRTHTDNKKVHTKHVLDSLTDPLKENNVEYVKDPCYGFKINKEELTDHFYDTTVAEWEWQRAKRLKEDHGFMGKMSFPENLNRTSRTIMATRSASTREAVLFGGKKDNKNKWKSYRMPTIREIASIMSFPITYQFQANNEASKYRLVGNAVCARESRALAKAILEKEGLETPKKFIPIEGNPKPDFDLKGQKRKIKKPPKKKITAKYARHIPYLKIRGFRVELNNQASDFEKEDIIWSAVLHQGSGKNALKCECSNNDVKSLVQNLKEFESFEEAIESNFSGMVPNAKKFQRIYCNIEDKDMLGPDDLLYKVRDFIDYYFPEDKYSDFWLENNNSTIEIKKDKIPARILAGQFALNKLVDKINN